MSEQVGVVSAIHIAPGSRLPVKEVATVEAEQGRGLVGDRYHGSRHRHVSVQSTDDLRAASEALGSDIKPGATRRNLTLTPGPVPTRPGQRFRIGTVELQVVRPAAPCRLLDDWISPGAMKAMHARGGAICRLLSSGSISVGDHLEVLD